MPVTPFSDDDDWLRTLMAAAQGAGPPGQPILPAPGASQPYGPGGLPQPYGAYMPGGGGGVHGYSARTPGAPSMGYPAMVRPPGMSLATPPPPMQASMNSAAALASDAGVNPHGDAPPNVMSPEEIYRLAAPQPAPTGAAVDSSVPPAPGYLNSTGASPSAPPSSDPRPYDAMVNAMTGNFGPGRRATPSPTPRPAPGARAAATAQASTRAQPAGPNRTPGAPNLGYYVPTTGNARGATYVPGAWPGGGQAPAAAAPAPAPAAAAPASAPSGSFDQATINRGVANFPGHWALSQDQLAAYMKTQPWLQNLGGAAGQQMTPAQLTSAVRRPNWWRQYT